ncbi:MAG: hypothetical protein FWE80_03400 [Oscillospiraceae bacterium]|nr:hypothetical protein [Oscillospiraceae bacterium]
MKRKWSLNAMLHNTKVIMIFSLVMAVTIWYVIITGMSNTTQKTISTTVTVDGAYIESFYKRRIFGDFEFPVSVTVEGPVSAISGITSDDIIVKAEIRLIDTGFNTLSLSASLAVGAPNCDIMNMTPKQVRVFCDYFERKVFPVMVDITDVEVEGVENAFPGTPVIDTAVLPEQAVTISGPQAVISRINGVEARIDGEKKISTRKTDFDAKLVALDAQGGELILDHCVMEEIPDPLNRMVTVNIPIDLVQEVFFIYDTEHMPPKQKENPDFVKIEPKSVRIRGEMNQINTYAGGIRYIGKLDFDRIGMDDIARNITLDIPEGIRVLDDIYDVTVRLEMKGYQEKTINLDFSLPEHNAVVRFINQPENYTANLVTSAMQVKVIGPAASVKSLTAADLSIEIDCGLLKPWDSNYCRVNINNREDIWVYYGEKSGYELIYEAVGNSD